MKYKVGDEVIIKSLEELLSLYDYSKMKKFLTDENNIKNIFGKKVKIARVFSISNENYYYTEEDNQKFVWPEKDIKCSLSEKKVEIIMKDLLDNNN